MTVKVAAFNASRTEVDAADFRCDGISDDVEINAATNFLNEVSLLRAKFGTNSWFTDAAGQLLTQYSGIEDRMEKSFHFVTLDKDQGNVYSYEFSSILRETGSVFCSVLDVLIRNSTRKPRKHYDFEAYRTFLNTYVPNVHAQVVAVRSVFPMVLIPFSALDSAGRPPRWWLAYKKVKRCAVANCKEANLANALGSVAALGIMGRHLECFLSTRLFTNIGLEYPPNDPATTKARILYDMT